MSLLDYERRFSQLRMNIMKGGKPSPHKVCMLKAVIKLIAEKVITDNRIYYNENLLRAFALQITPYMSEGIRNSPNLPYFHLRSERFWHHQINSQEREKYEHTESVSSDKAIRELIDYAYLDDELFELLQLTTVRELLTQSLDRNLDDSERDSLLKDGDAWTALECEATVAHYFSMLRDELSGTPYNKAQHRRTLVQKLKNRTEGSIEFKHQNISAVLIASGLPYITGYKPLYNYQSSLKNIVLAYIAANQSTLEAALRNEPETMQKVADIGSWTDIIVEPPTSDSSVNSDEVEDIRLRRPFLGRFVDYAKKDHNNRNLGRAGEEFVLLFEQHKLRQSTNANLAKSIRWASDEEGDGLGYDIRSFNENTGEELFIEVKTTSRGMYQPFYISKNEVEFSHINAPHYSLYRVFDFKNSPRVFQLPGDVQKNVKLIPNNFTARI